MPTPPNPSTESPQSSTTDSTNTVDTATASGRLQGPRHFSTWQRPSFSDAGPSSKDSSKASNRPLSGKSRKELQLHIETLHREKAELEAQWRQMTASSSSEKKGTEEGAANAMPDRTQGPLQQSPPLHSSSAIRPDIPPDKSQHTSNARETSFPSPFAEYNEGVGNAEEDYLGSVVTLAGRLRQLLTGKESSDVKENESRFLRDPEVCKMLLRATPHPERVVAYSQVFAKRR
jgi:hypothetical protein